MDAGDRCLREVFEQTMQRLEDEVLRMGSLVAQQLGRAVGALKRSDPVEAAAVIADDDRFDQMHLDIERRVLVLMATQQPMARDLRILTAVLAVSIDLERLADHAEAIADAAIRLSRHDPLKPLVDIPYMAQITQGMLHDALEAFARRDTVLAEAVAVKDDTVDALRSQVFRELLTYMAESPRTISRALDLVLVAQHLERSADLVTNIAERVIFMITGEMRKLNVSAPVTRVR